MPKSSISENVALLFSLSLHGLKLRKIVKDQSGCIKKITQNGKEILTAIRHLCKKKKKARKSKNHSVEGKKKEENLKKKKKKKVQIPIRQKYFYLT